MNLEERKIALHEKWFEFRKEIFEKGQQEQKKYLSESKLKSFSPVYATIVVAFIGFLGTTIATIVNNYNQNILEQRKFESELIKKSLDEQTQDNKIKALKLLTILHLIKDNDIKNALNNFLQDTTNAIKALPTANLSLPQPLLIFPNPIASNSKLNIRWKDSVTANQVIEIYDAEGNLLQHETIIINKPTNQQNIKLNNFSSGSIA